MGGHRDRARLSGALRDRAAPPPDDQRREKRDRPSDQQRRQKVDPTRPALPLREPVDEDRRQDEQDEQGKQPEQMGCRDREHSP